jgi:hypothetical protein
MTHQHPSKYEKNSNKPSKREKLTQSSREKRLERLNKAVENKCTTQSYWKYNEGRNKEETKKATTREQHIKLKA